MNIRPLSGRTGIALASGALAAFLTASAPPAEAASFDCAKARTADERAICASPALSALDSEMGALWFSYSRFPLLMGASGARRDDAQAFLAARGKCGADTGCIENLYRARNAELKQQITGEIGSLANQANADPAPSSALPGPVAARIASFPKQCRDLGGDLAGTGQPVIATADLDKDGRPDFILDTSSLSCEGAATAFCANDGCSVFIALSSEGFQPHEYRGAKPTLALDYKDAALELWVDRFNCDDSKPGDACWGTWRWDGSALTPTYSLRPAN